MEERELKLVYQVNICGPAWEVHFNTSDYHFHHRAKSQIYMKSRGSNKRENSWIFATIGYLWNYNRIINGITIGHLWNKVSNEWYDRLASSNGEKWGEMKKFDWTDLSCSWYCIERKAEKKTPLWSGPSPAKLGSSPNLAVTTNEDANKQKIEW